jgi:hypothetical protein
MATMLLYREDGTECEADVTHGPAISTSNMDSTYRTSLPGQNIVSLNGIPLNRVDENTFANPATGELLSRTPPARK